MKPSEAFDRSTVAIALLGGAVAVAAALVVADRSVAITSQTPLIVGGIVGAVAASAWILRATRVNPPPRLRAAEAAGSTESSSSAGPTQKIAAGGATRKQSGREPITAPYVPTPGLLQIRLPKMGSSMEECEDAISVSADMRRFAVSDGASSSYGAGPWAQQLAHGFVRKPPRFGDLAKFEEWLAALAAAPLEPVHLNQQPTAGWWADEGERRGAFATLLGVELGSNAGVQRWRAVSVGDCCVVHLRSSDKALRMVCSFPIEASDGFASVPNLLHSMNPEAVGVRWAEGTSRAGDTLILMSDAVACWALAAPDNLARVASLGEDALTQMLIESRRNHLIVNDDISVIRVGL